MEYVYVRGARALTALLFMNALPVIILNFKLCASDSLYFEYQIGK